MVQLRPGSNPGKTGNKLDVKFPSVNDFPDSCFGLIYTCTFTSRRVWAWSRDFNFFTNKKRGVEYGQTDRLAGRTIDLDEQNERFFVK